MTAAAGRDGRRELAVAVLLVVVGALLAILASPRSAGRTPGMPTPPGAATGTGAPTALAVVALAGAGAMLLVRNRSRVLLGLALVAVTAGLVAVSTSPVRWVGLLGAGLVGLGGGLVVVRARGWPQPRTQQEARAAPLATPQDAWEALDRGEDPTD